MSSSTLHVTCVVKCVCVCVCEIFHTTTRLFYSCEYNECVQCEKKLDIREKMQMKCTQVTMIFHWLSLSLLCNCYDETLLYDDVDLSNFVRFTWCDDSFDYREQEETLSQLKRVIDLCDVQLIDLIFYFFLRLDFSHTNLCCWVSRWINVKARTRRKGGEIQTQKKTLTHTHIMIEASGCS